MVQYAEPTCLPLRARHINDAWHNVPSRWPTSEGPEQDPEVAEDQLFLHDAPDSIQRLYDVFMQNGLVDGPRLTDAIHVQSWYLHHLHHPHWYTPRVLELEGHWRHWARDIASGWTDYVRTDEDIAFAVCNPDPPRNAGQHKIFLDLLLVQGLEMQFWPGLIAVLQADDRAAGAEYALAVSLSQYVWTTTCSTSQPGSEDALQAAHIYRLGQLPAFGHLNWRSYHTALRDAAQLLRVPLNQFVGFHYTQVPLPGQQAGEEAIIRQHINDVGVGSQEKLVIDIVYHTNPLVQKDYKRDL